MYYKGLKNQVEGDYGQQERAGKNTMQCLVHYNSDKEGNEEAETHSCDCTLSTGAT